jgi:hypothetical protein
LCQPRATASAVSAILKNPACAGAFVCGRTRSRAPRDDRAAATAATPIEDGRIVVKDRDPACIDRPTHEKICSIVSDNRAEDMRTKT